MFKRRTLSYSITKTQNSSENSLQFLKNELNKAKDSVQYLKEESSLLNNMYEKTAASCSAKPNETPQKCNKSFINNIKAKKTDIKSVYEMNKSFSGQISNNKATNNIPLNISKKQDHNFYNPIYRKLRRNRSNMNDLEINKLKVHNESLSIAKHSYQSSIWEREEQINTLKRELEIQKDINDNMKKQMLYSDDVPGNNFANNTTTFQALNQNPHKKKFEFTNQNEHILSSVISNNISPMSLSTNVLEKCKTVLENDTGNQDLYKKLNEIIEDHKIDKQYRISAKSNFDDSVVPPMITDANVSMLGLLNQINENQPRVYLNLDTSQDTSNENSYIEKMANKNPVGESCDFHGALNLIKHDIKRIDNKIIKGSRNHSRKETRVLADEFKMVKPAKTNNYIKTDKYPTSKINSRPSSSKNSAESINKYKSLGKDVGKLKSNLVKNRNSATKKRDRLNSSIEMMYSDSGDEKRINIKPPKSMNTSELVDNFLTVPNTGVQRKSPLKKTTASNEGFYKHENLSTVKSFIFPTEAERVSYADKIEKQKSPSVVRNSYEVNKTAINPMNTTFELVNSSMCFSRKALMEDRFSNNYAPIHPIYTNSKNNTANIDHKCNIVKEMNERGNTQFYDKSGNILDMATGSITSVKFGVVVNDINKIVDECNNFVNLRKSRIENHSGKIIEIGVLRFRDIDRNIFDLAAGRILNKEGNLMIPNIFEFYDTKGERCDIYELPNIRHQHKAVKNYSKSYLKKNIVCDFDMRQIDLKKMQIYDFHGNIICDQIGTFTDKTGNKLDLLTGLVRTKTGQKPIINPICFIQNDEFGNKANLKARKLCNKEGATIFKDLGIIKDVTGNYVDLMNGNICGINGEILSDEKLEEVEDHYGNKIQFNEQKILDSNGFFLTDNFDLEFRFEYEGNNKEFNDALSRHSKKAGRDNMTLTRKFSLKSIPDTNVTLNLRTGFIKNYDGDVTFLRKGKFEDDYKNTISLKDSVLKDEEGNPLFYFVGVIKDELGRQYDLKKGAIIADSEYNNYKKRAFDHKKTDGESKSEDAIQLTDEIGNTYDITNGTIKNVSEKFIEENLKYFGDAKSNIFTAEKMFLLGEEEEVPSFVHHRIWDPNQRSLDLITGTVYDAQGRVIFSDLINLLGFRYKYVKNEEKCVKGRREDDPTTEDMSSRGSGIDDDQSITKDWQKEKMMPYLIRAVHAEYRAKRKEREKLERGMGKGKFTSTMNRGSIRNISYKHKNEAEFLVKHSFRADSSSDSFGEGDDTKKNLKPKDLQSKKVMGKENLPGMALIKDYRKSISKVKSIRSIKNISKRSLVSGFFQKNTDNSIEEKSKRTDCEKLSDIFSKSPVNGNKLMMMNTLQIPTQDRDKKGSIFLRMNQKSEKSTQEGKNSKDENKKNLYKSSTNDMIISSRKESAKFGSLDDSKKLISKRKGTPRKI